MPLIDIWNNGAEGTGAAMAGVIYALPALLLLGGVGAAAILYPRLTDITTDLADPPRFEAAPDQRPEPRPAETAALQRRAYPDVAARAYPLPLDPVYEAVRKLVEDRGWTITEDIEPGSSAAAGSRGPYRRNSPAPRSTRSCCRRSTRNELVQSRGGEVLGAEAVHGA